jgi:hypothetical protein
LGAEPTTSKHVVDYAVDAKNLSWLGLTIGFPQMHQEDAMEFSCDQESYIILSPSFFHFILFMSCFGASHYGT